MLVGIGFQQQKQKHIKGSKLTMYRFVPQKKQTLAKLYTKIPTVV